MKKEEEVGLLFPAARKRVQPDCYPWHQLQLPRPQQQPTKVPEPGPLPREWRWGRDFPPAILSWPRELHWLPTDDDAPVGHGQVSLMELALDFESHAGRPLPPTPQLRFTGSEMSLQEKGRVLRLAVTLLGRAAGRESILPATITTRCRALVPLGAGMVVGVKGRPLLTRPAAVWHHVQRLRQYNSEPWARQQQQRVARRKHKQRRAQGKPATSPGGNSGQRERCPGKGEARRPGRMLVISTRAPSCRRGPAEAHSTRWWNRRTAPYQMQGRCFSRRHNAAPRPDARSSTPGDHAFGFSQHTNSDSVPHALRWDGGYGTAAPGGTSGIPAPLHMSAVDRPGHRAERGRRGCTHRGGGGAQRRDPSDASRSQCEEARPPREDGSTLTPPPPHEVGVSDAAGRGQAWARWDRGHITPPQQRF